LVVYTTRHGQFPGRAKSPRQSNGSPRPAARKPRAKKAAAPAREKQLYEHIFQFNEMMASLSEWIDQNFGKELDALAPMDENGL
jgi:hypothetical protein